MSPLPWYRGGTGGFEGGDGVKAALENGYFGTGGGAGVGGGVGALAAALAPALAAFLGAAVAIDRVHCCKDFSNMEVEAMSGSRALAVTLARVDFRARASLQITKVEYTRQVPAIQPQIDLEMRKQPKSHLSG